MRSGKPAQMSDFRQGDRLTATIITSKPPTVVTEKEVQATLASAGEAARVGGWLDGCQERRSASTAAGWCGASGGASGGGARTLPKTASHRPLLGFGGAVSLLIGIVLAVRRRYVS